MQDIKLDINVDNRETQEGVYVYGLFLEGAGWDRRNMRLCESASKVLFVIMPVIHIFALYNVPDKSPKLYQVSD